MYSVLTGKEITSKRSKPVIARGGSDGDMKSIIKNWNNYIDECEESIRVANEARTRAEEELRLLKNKYESDVATARSRSDAEVAKMNQEMAKVNQDVIRLQSMIAQYEYECKSEKKMRVEAETAKEKLRQELNSANQKYASHMATIDELKKTQTSVVQKIEKAGPSAYEITFKRDPNGIHGATVKIIKEKSDGINV